MKARPDDLADRDNWHGGFYELAVLLGREDDERVEAAARAVGNSPGLDGPDASHSPPGAG